MPGFDNRVDTTTLDWLVPKVVDTILRENVFTTAMLAKTEKFKSSTMDFPIKWTKGVSGTSFSGFDTLPAAASDTRVYMVYQPRFYAENVALPGTDLSANNTAQKVLDLAEIEMRSRAQDCADDIGNLFYLDGTGNSNKDFLGLAAVVDDGTNVPTIGNLSRSTYPTLDSTVTASGGLLTLLGLRTLYNNIVDGPVQPSAIYTTRPVGAYYEALLQPQERIMKDVRIAENFKGYTGYKSMEYNGMSVLLDRKCTSGYLFMLNEDYLKFYELPWWDGQEVPVKNSEIVGNQYEEEGGLGFTWTGWIKPSNAAAVNSFLILGGQLITDNPRRQAKFTGITGS